MNKDKAAPEGPTFKTEIREHIERGVTIHVPIDGVSSSGVGPTPGDTMRVSLHESKDSTGEGAQPLYVTIVRRRGQATGYTEESMRFSPEMWERLKRAVDAAQAAYRARWPL